MFNFAVLACNVRSAISGITDQLAIWNHRPLRREEGALDVRKLLFSEQGPQHLPSVESGYMLAEVAGPRGPHTLFVSSISDGGSSMQHCLTRRCGCDLVGFTASADKVAFPLNSMYLIREFEVLRLVRSMRDSNRWEFYQKGTPLWFENPGYYAATLVKKRLMNVTIDEYISKFGYGSLELEFWTQKSVQASYFFDEGFQPWSGK